MLQLLWISERSSKRYSFPSKNNGLIKNLFKLDCKTRILGEGRSRRNQKSVKFELQEKELKLNIFIGVY